MADVKWELLARAVSCALEWERLNNRGAFLDENSLRRAIAEHLQSVTAAVVEPEYNHPDIPGNKRLDIAGFGPQKKAIDFAVESKWIKEGGGTRDWPAEVGDDIFRLEMLQQDMAQQNDRILVVSGIHNRINSGLMKKKKNVGGGVRVDWIDAILPANLATQSRKFKVRECDAPFSDFFKKRSESVGVPQLPVSYQAQLVGYYHVAPSDGESVETYVWRISRSQNRSLFTP